MQEFSIDVKFDRDFIDLGNSSFEVTVRDKSDNTKIKIPANLPELPFAEVCKEKTKRPVKYPEHRNKFVFFHSFVKYILFGITKKPSEKENYVAATRYCHIQ